MNCSTACSGDEPTVSPLRACTMISTKFNCHNEASLRCKCSGLSPKELAAVSIQVL